MISPSVDAVIAASHPAPEAGGPCATCAVRPGAEAHRAEHTQMLLRLCVEGGRPFYCHEREHLCRGFIAAINLRGAAETDAQKRHVEACGIIADIYANAVAGASGGQP